MLTCHDVVAAVERLVDEVAAGRSGALFVVACAGLGKTSVLEQACAIATGAGLDVRLGRGHPMETGLPFALLAEVLDGLGGRTLPHGEQAASTSAGERTAWFYGVLRWLQGRIGQPLLLAVDDMHWADPDSVALLSFICRRMDQLPLGLIASLRPWPPDAHEVVAWLVSEGRGIVRRLGPLGEEAAGWLLEDRLGRPVPDAVRRRAFALSAGNPLLIGHLAATTDRDGCLPESAGPTRAMFGRDVLARFVGVSATGMRCAQAASVLGAGFVPEVAAQVAGLEGGEIDAALEALGRTGLVEQRPGSAADFAHPLVGQALYDDLPSPGRTRLHARAFAVLHARGLDAQAAEHAIQAHLVGDLEAAAVVERAGRAARRAGALAIAVRRLEAAVAMAADRANIDLLLAHAEALLAVGQADRAINVYEPLLSRADVAARRRPEVLWMLARALVMTGDHEQAAAAFEEASRTAGDHDRGIEAEVLLDAALSRWLTAGPGPALPISGRARELASSLGGEIRTRADAGWGRVALHAGDPAGMAAAEPAAPWLRSRQRDRWRLDARGVVGEWGPVHAFAWCAVLAERLQEADRAFTAARACAERAGCPPTAALLACGHGYALTRMGRLDEALAAVNVALTLPGLAPLTKSLATAGSAWIQLYMGRLDDGARCCERAAATAADRGELAALLLLLDVLGHRCLREGATAEACDHYARLEATAAGMGIGEPCLPPWARHAVSAYLAGGRTGDAERVLGWLGQAAARLPCRFPRIAAATGRAQLAELAGNRADAEDHFRAALALHDEVALPLELSETLLAYGGFLRRSGRLAAARHVLTRATDVAQKAGAAWLADLAQAERRVAGGRRRRAAASMLTAQEQRIARLAASGATSAQIAHQLYLSVRTVEKHLERIYAKLSVHSRYELIARAAGASLGPEPKP